MKRALFFPEDVEHNSEGFTLVELLVVIAIILIIAGAILPALKGSFEGINLSGASDVVVGQLLAARQMAASRNLTVELRIYNSNASSTSNNPSTALWNTIALLIPKDVSGRVADEWLGTPQTLPSGLIFDAGPTGATTNSFSTIIAQGVTGGGTSAPTPTTPNAVVPWKVSSEATSAPYALRSHTYVAFRFQPDGTTDLPSTLLNSTTSTPWCLTIRSPHSKPAASAQYPAANYATLVLDPLNGRTSSYRP